MTWFLSYARADQTTALKLADDLKSAGVRLWVDQYDIRPSDHWDRVVETALCDSAGIIVLLSPQSSASPNVADEVALALDRGKRVVPVMIEPCRPPLRMLRLQYIDAGADYGKALDRVLAAISEPAPAASAPPLGIHAGGPKRLPQTVIDAAEQQLTRLIGPIAGRIIDRAVDGASNKAELYHALAVNIKDPGERETFLRAVVPAAPAPTRGDPVPVALELNDADRAALTETLTRYLGPIAPRLVDRARAQAPTREALYQRLAEAIRLPAERNAFLAEVSR